MATRPVWFFDLDNTLHDASWKIYAELDRGINAFIERHLGLGRLEADALRRRYWERYGATLSGLVAHHGIRVDHYVAETHAFIEQGAPTMIRTEPGLSQSLARLPGKKILLTNAPTAYARRVLETLGIDHHFGRAIAIEQMHLHRQLRPKPSRALLRALAARHRLAAGQAILVEDTLANLKSARAEGWKTVHVAGFLQQRPNSRNCRPAYVDLQVKSIAQLVHRYRLVYPDAK